MLFTFPGSREKARLSSIIIVSSILLIACGVLGHKGYLGRWFGAGETAFARATAPAVADAGIKELEKSDVDMASKSRKCRVESRMLKRECDDLIKDVAEKRDAIKKLALAASENGLPAPKEGFVLAPHEASKEIAFNDKVIKGVDVYRLIDGWLNDCEEGEKLIASKNATANRLDDVAAKIERKRVEIQSEIDRLRDKLKELESTRDRAKAEKALAELEANINGINSGRVGKALETIEDEIRQLEAESDELISDKLSKVDPKDVVSAKKSSDRYAELSALWNAD
ncbi:MAG: hypothetical protein J6X44_10995 [Thermoguttaceae bacterium]|nr:hypothetical protein [Thermoguttaceae bacterium]